MKWAVTIMTALGVAAAVCAAILIAILLHPSGQRAGPAAPPPKATVLLAAKDLPAMAVVRAQDVTTQTMARSKAPAQFLANSVQVVGRVLAVPMVKGEAFTPGIFASQGVGADLAAAIPFGKRAIGISISNYAALQGMLYPGCTVDVLLTMSAKNALGGTIATTVLQNIEVLAINNQSVDSPPSTGGARQGESGTPRVILMVSAKQAKILDLASHAGTLALALRNPLDRRPGNKQTVTFTSLAADDFLLNLYARQYLRQRMAAMATAASSAKPEKSVEPAVISAMPVPVQWQVEVIRGPQSQTQSFPLSEVKP